MHEIIKNIVWKQGTSRKDRLAAVLNTEALDLIDRSLVDDINLANEYAALFRFYGTDNKPKGTWRPFFEKDELFILASIIKTDLTALHEDFDRLDNRLFLIKHQDSKKTPLLREVYRLVLQLTGQVSRWFEALDAQVERQGMLAEIRDAINNTMRPRLNTLREYRDWSLREGILTDDMAQAIEDLPSIWHPRGEQNCNHVGEIKSFANLLRVIYHEYINTMRYLVRIANKYFEDSLHASQRHDPQVALMITFLQLFRHARREINEIPQRHLDYYFRHVLNDQELPSQPGPVIVHFDLESDTPSTAVPAGTALIAGKDGLGNDLLYHTSDTVIVTGVQIAEIRQLYLSREGEQFPPEKNPYRELNIIPPIRQLYSQFFDPASAEEGWFTVGREQAVLSQSEQHMQESHFGFMLASTIFHGSPGKRDFVVQFKLEKCDNRFEVDTLDAAFDLALSAEDGWHPISAYDGYLSDEAFEIRFSLSDEDPAIPIEAPYAAPDSINWPVLRIGLRRDASNTVYDFLKQFEVSEIKIELEVQGMQDLSLFNGDGPMPSNESFPLFGTFPSNTSFLHIGAGEVFHKQVDEVSLELQWKDLPELECGLEEYYKDYPYPWDNHSFQVQVSFLKNGQWEPAPRYRKEFLLFPGRYNNPSGPLEPITCLTGLEIDEVDLPHQNHRQDTTEYSNQLKRGFIRIDLVAPQKAFGHQEYPNLVSEITVYNNTPVLMRRKSDKQPVYMPRREDEMKPIPREPFTPMVETVKLNYKASVRCKFPDADRGQICFYHSYPSGFLSSHQTKNSSLPLLVDFGQLRGSFYLGLANLEAPESLSFHIEMRERPGDITSGSGKPPTWSYLSHNEWLPLNYGKDIIYDHTGGLKYSGIVRIEIPGNISLGNHNMPGHLHWLKVSIPYGAYYADRIKSIKLNAVEATWQPISPEQEHPDMPLPPESITALQIPLPGIAGVAQPDMALNHRSKEQEEDFLLRLSERMRHKNRAVSEWDYEHLLMEQFPYLSHVICFPAIAIAMESGRPKSRKAPGELVVVVMQEMKQRGPKPDVRDAMVSYSNLFRIKEYLNYASPGFVDIAVMNPIFEWIQVETQILFEPGYNSGYYLRLLNQEINDFYAPWLHDPSQKVSLGGSALKGDLIAYIESRHYVNHLKTIKMTLYDERGQVIEDDLDHTLTSTTPWSLMVPMDQHIIIGVEETEEQSPTGHVGQSNKNRPH